MVEIKMQGNGQFSIMEKGEVVGEGNMVLPENDDDFAYLERLDIVESQRRKGYGTAAIGEIQKIFGSFYITPDNEDAQRLYARLGDEISSADYDRFGFAIDCGFGVYAI